MAAKSNGNNNSLASRYACWPSLQANAELLKGTSITQLFADNPQRVEEFSLEAAGLRLDFSKNLVNTETLQLFSSLSEQAKLPEAIHALSTGEVVNHTEKRPAWHSALRSANTSEEVNQTLLRMEQLVNAVRSGSWRGYSGEAITDVVNIGIGGSDLGPHMVSHALMPYRHTDGSTLSCHYVSNIDPSDLNEVLAQLRPQTTLFIVASKSFTTLETLSNANKARDWLLQHDSDADTGKHFIAVSTAIDKAVAFGVDAENILPMWDWVGGRYSLWSAIGISIAMGIGMNHFRELLAGAHAMDQHFANAPASENMPILLALLGIWYSHFWHAQSYAVLPYDHYLKLLPEFLQQLDMESNGKNVNQNGEAIDYNSGPIVWGAAGTNGQHSFHQLLHQGTRFVPVDFILPLTSHQTSATDQQQHRHLVANCLSQSKALAEGKSLQTVKQELAESGLSDTEIETLTPHKVIAGNRPNNIISFTQVTPRNLGALIALYEHKVYVQSVIWQINAFDQWGVELGKQLSNKVFNRLSGDNSETFDASTQALIDHYTNANSPTK